MSVRLRVLGAASLALAAALYAAPAASATEGSVPVEVADFVAAPDGLIASLEDFFGPGPDGAGIDFDDSTEFGAIDRVFTFTPDWLAGADTDVPVGLANEWTVPVSVGGEPIGVGIVWINPQTVRPQLADFLPDPVFATKLPDVATTAYVVHDSDRAAWLAVDAPGLAVLVPGTSGLSGDTRLAVYRAAIATTDEAPAGDAGVSPGIVLSVGTIVAVCLIVVLVLKLRGIRRSPSLTEAKDRRFPKD